MQITFNGSEFIDNHTIYDENNGDIYNQDSQIEGFNLIENALEIQLIKKFMLLIREFGVQDGKIVHLFLDDYPRPVLWQNIKELLYNLHNLKTIGIYLGSIDELDNELYEDVSQYRSLHISFIVNIFHFLQNKSKISPILGLFSDYESSEMNEVCEKCGILYRDPENATK